MKKMFKVIATVTAILSMANFVACKSDDDSSDDTVAVTSVELDQSTASIAVGKTVTLTATVAPTNATNAEVRWTSSDTSVAIVSGGTVTGVKEGTAIITATAGGKSASATITVTAASTDSGSTDTDGSSTDTDSGSTDTDGSGDSSTDTTAVLDVVYDLTTGLPSDFPTADSLVSSDWAAPTADPTTNDITWAWLTTTTRKVKSNSGLQVSNGTSAEDLITLSADSNFTVTITYKFAGAYDAAKVRCLSAGDQSVSMESTTDKDTTYTLTTSAAKSVTIAANGMKITKIATSAAE